MNAKAKARIGAMLLCCIFIAGMAVAQPAIIESFDKSARPTCLAENLLKKPTASIGPYGRNGTAGVRIQYEGFDLGSRRTVFSCPLPKRGSEYTLSYDVRFDKNFQFVKGGKLHGLGPQKIMSGGDGTSPEGWSARVAFRPDGGIETYIYHQNQKGNFGEIDRAKDFKFEKGIMYKVSLYVKVNSSANASDGVVRLYVDNKLLVERENLRLRAVNGDAGLISRVLFSTFHGGGSPEWAPKDERGNYTSVFADFDNIEVDIGKPAALR
jgi:hypothetical protein